MSNVERKIQTSLAHDKAPLTADVGSVLDRVRRRHRRRRATAGIVALGVAAAGLSFPLLHSVREPRPLTAVAQADQPAYPAMTQLGDGWYQISTGPINDASRDAVTWASSTGFALQDRIAFADGRSRGVPPLDAMSFGSSTLRALPDLGIVIRVASVQASWNRNPQSLDFGEISAFPPRSTPLAFAELTEVTDWNPPTPGLVQYALGTTLGAQVFDVRVFVSTSSPAAVALAEAGLSNIVFPEGPGSVVTPPVLDQTPMWTTLSTSSFALDPESTPQAWASNYPFSNVDTDLFVRSGILWYSGLPTASIDALPPDGIVVIASLQLPADTVLSPGSPNLEPVRLDLSSAEIQTHWEGQQNPNVALYVFWPSPESPVEVRVYFGSLTPDGALLDAAQAELDTLQVPLTGTEGDI